MSSPFRTRDFSGGYNPHTHRRHRSSSSGTFQHHTSHTNATPPTRHEPRQAGLLLDFIIIGGGLFHVLCTMLFTTYTLLRQGSQGFLQHTRSLPRAIAFKCLSKRAV
jgi:hypothetical protein